jgi:YjbR
VNNPDLSASHEWVKAVCETKGLVQGSHHGRVDFRLAGKIVVNVENESSITIKLPLDEQQALLSDYPEFVSLPNGWGHHGWTTLQIDDIGPEIITELIDTSIRTIGSTKRTGR